MNPEIPHDEFFQLTANRLTALSKLISKHDSGGAAILTAGARIFSDPRSDSPTLASIASEGFTDFGPNISFFIRVLPGIILARENDVINDSFFICDRGGDVIERLKQEIPEKIVHEASSRKPYISDINHLGIFTKAREVAFEAMFGKEDYPPNILIVLEHYLHNFDPQKPNTVKESEINLYSNFFLRASGSIIRYITCIDSRGGKDSIKKLQNDDWPTKEFPRLLAAFRLRQLRQGISMRNTQDVIDYALRKPKED